MILYSISHNKSISYGPENMLSTSACQYCKSKLVPGSYQQNTNFSSMLKFWILPLSRSLSVDHVFPSLTICLPQFQRIGLCKYYMHHVISFCKTRFEHHTIGDLPVLISFISIFHGGHANWCGGNNINFIKQSLVHILIDLHIHACWIIAFSSDIESNTVKV
jgi:hypothetical protein